MGRGGDSRVPLIQYWDSEEIPTEVAELIATFRDRNPDLDHRVFSRAEAERFIGERYTARELAAFQACAVPAMQADYFRYCAVLALGGIYVDADFHCLRPLVGLIDTTEEGLLFQKSPRGNLVNSFLVFKRAGHPLLRLAIDVAGANIERRIPRAVNAITGPWVLTSLLALHQLGSFDAARQAARGEPRRAERLFATVGDYARIDEAFQGVRIEPFALATEWIGDPPRPLRYKRADRHWSNWRGWKVQE